MKNDKKIKNLLCGLAATSNPLFLVSELLFSEWPFLKKILDKDGNIVKFNKNLFGENKYDGTEFMMVGVFDKNWNIREDKIESYKKLGIPFYTFHGCYEGFPKRYKNIYLNLAENSNDQIKKAIHSHIEAASILKRDEKTILVFHPGIIRRKNNREKGFVNVIKNLESCLDFAQKKKVVVCIENMPWGWGSGEINFCNDAHDLKYILDKVNHPNLKITFDWGHLNSYLMNDNFRKKYYQEGEECYYFDHINDFINILGKDIVHSHIHYNRCHLSKYKKFKKGTLNKLFVYIIFWTDLSKFIRKEKNKYFYDEHLTLSNIGGKYLKGFEKTINNLLEKSSIRDLGFITHEYTNRKIFRLFSFSRNGVYSDYLESLRIFRDMYKDKFDTD